jgi:hypothetical protein
MTARVTTTALESVLNSRIDQAIAVTPPTDQSQIDLLEGIRAIESYPSRVAGFADFLIDHIVTLSKELSDTKLQIARLEEETPPKRNRLTPNEDYEQCLRLLRTSRDHLSVSLDQLIAQNEELRRVRKQDRVILLRQNERLIQLQRKAGAAREIEVEEIPVEEVGGPGCDDLKRDFRMMSDELETLTKEVNLRNPHRSRRRR